MPELHRPQLGKQYFACHARRTLEVPVKSAKAGPKVEDLDELPGGVGVPSSLLKQGVTGSNPVATYLEGSVKVATYLEGSVKVSSQISLCNLFLTTQPNDQEIVIGGLNEEGPCSKQWRNYRPRRPRYGGSKIGLKFGTFFANLTKVLA